MTVLLWALIAAAAAPILIALAVLALLTALALWVLPDPCPKPSKGTQS